MEEEIRFRCDKDFKDDVEAKYKEEGFSSVAEYIRFTIKKDLKK